MGKVTFRTKRGKTKRFKSKAARDRFKRVHDRLTKRK